MNIQYTDNQLYIEQHIDYEKSILVVYTLKLKNIFLCKVFLLFKQQKKQTMLLPNNQIRCQFKGLSWCVSSGHNHTKVLILMPGDKLILWVMQGLAR